MNRILVAAAACAVLLSAGTMVAPDAAYAKNDKNQAELKACKDIADPGAKDECVKQSGGKGKGAAQKEKKAKKAKNGKK